MVLVIGRNGRLSGLSGLNRLNRLKPTKGIRPDRMALLSNSVRVDRLGLGLELGLGM